MINTSTTDNGTTEATWLSVATVASRLGTTKRAVQKRCAKGTLPARLVEGERGQVWEVRADALRANSAANHEREPRANANPAGSPQNLNPATKQREPQGEPRTPESERERELRDEVRFLRSVIEQLQRDGAETRAALRKALDNAPKQLSSGYSSTNNDGAQIAPQTAQNAPREAKQGDGSITDADGEEMSEDELLALCGRIVTRGSP